MLTRVYLICHHLVVFNYRIPGNFHVAKFLRFHKFLLSREIKFREIIAMPHFLYCTRGSFAKTYDAKNSWYMVCLPMFTRASLPMFTHVYSFLPMFTHVYLCLPLFTCLYLWLPLMFTYVYSCLIMFPILYSGFFYLRLPVITLVYPCLHLFTYVYPCLLIFTYVWHV